MESIDIRREQIYCVGLEEWTTGLRVKLINVYNFICLLRWILQLNNGKHKQSVFSSIRS